MLIVVALLVAALAGGLIWRWVHGADAALSEHVEAWSDERRAAYASVTAQALDTAMMQADTLAHDPLVVSAVVDGVRALATEGGGRGGPVTDRYRRSLDSRLSGAWTLATERYGLRELQVHAGPEGRALLRLHAPGWYGDVTGPVRPMVAGVLRDGVLRAGFAIDATGAALRGLAPVHDPRTPGAPPVAVIEVGLGFEVVFRHVVETAGGDFAVLLSAEAATRHVAAPFLRLPFDAACACVLEAATSPEIGGLIAGLPEVLLADGAARPATALFPSPIWTMPDRWIAAAVWPLPGEDAAEGPVGWVVTWKDMTRRVAATHAETRTLVALALVALVVILLLLWASMRYATGALQRIVAEKTRDIDESRRAAVAANAAKSRFLATMSHEIRTPMNGVLGMADLLEATDLDASQRRMVTTIRTSGDILLATINDILDASKLETGAMRLETAPFDMADLAARVRDLHAASAERKGLDLTLTVDGTRHGRLGDAHRVQQILHNLVSNAIKFTDRGGVAIALDLTRSADLALRVADDGIGMTAAQAARVFQPFSQADESITRRFGGTGLGLWIVRSLADAMGGRIDLDSAPGEGSEFTVSLPLAAATVAAGPAEAAVDTAALAGLRVLAADDNPINRAVLQGLLDRLGVAADVAEGGAEVIAAFGIDQRYDAILLDISMPEVDGFAAMRAIRAAAAARNVAVPPLIACTASAMPEEIAAFLGHGFDGHLPKPLTAKTLSRALAAITASADARVSAA